MVLRSTHKSLPWLRHFFTDGGYAGPKLPGAPKGQGDWRIEIITRSGAARGDDVLPRRWVLELADPWLARCRRLAKDPQASTSNVEAWLLIVHIRIMIRRLVRFHLRA
jgi:transposase